MAFSPVLFYKGSDVETATSTEDYYQFLWDGWTLGGPAPAIPPEFDFASQADFDEFVASFPKITVAPTASPPVAPVLNQVWIRTP